MKDETYRVTDFILPPSSFILFLVDPTGLKPALPRHPVSSSPCPLLEAMKGLEPLSTGLQDRRSDSQLSYIATRIADFGIANCEISTTSARRDPLHFAIPHFAIRNFLLVDRGGTQTLTCSLQDCHAVKLHHPPRGD